MFGTSKIDRARKNNKKEALLHDLTVKKLSEEHGSNMGLIAATIRQLKDDLVA